MVKVIFTRAYADGYEQWVSVELPTYRRAVNLAQRINSGQPVQQELAGALHGEHCGEPDDAPYRDFGASVTS